MTHPLFQKPFFTIGDLYHAVLSIHDGEAALAFFEEYVAYTLGHAKDARFHTLQGATRLAQSNIGWIFGEGMRPEDIVMWTEACGASHPVFGDRITRITPEDAFTAGRAVRSVGGL